MLVRARTFLALTAKVRIRPPKCSAKTRATGMLDAGALAFAKVLTETSARTTRGISKQHAVLGGILRPEEAVRSYVRCPYGNGLRLPPCRMG